MHEYETFDLEASTADAWTSFTERLSEVLAVMDDTGDLSIGMLLADAEGETPFVRFACDAARVLTLEAASNAQLTERYQLGVTSLDLMSRMGWHDPNVDGEHPTPCFWARFDQEDAAAAAALTVRTLRDVYGVQHPAFLAPDQLADVLTPRPQPMQGRTPFAAEDVIAYLADDRAHLDAMIAEELTQLFGHEPFRDADGDYAIRFGSTMVFVRSTPDAREVLVFSAVVHDVEGRSRAVEVLNDLNSEARYVRFQLVRDRVFVNMSVLAHPFVPAHLHQAISAVAQVADGVDDDLAAKLHGRTTFPNENPR
ncbi:T3SS (YopN, CesT) and YbjN peptide-binding chaperone 1 [Propionicicella superfundia]|uniref:T3SS (YopN, CesT) and YbjN peptide-binding chaperone 1 n=1 Tax=Propionicicella superfundia TaxID=348582 RepID=UPI00048B1DC7|nr:YbjN domain-containing protein [Propionicicella superfundia]